MKREYLYDNIKAFLIFCVVLGHMLEGFLEGSVKAVYVLIYSFHMPMFVFISGMFARFEPDRILKKIVLPYIVFQGINCLWKGSGFQFTTPVWTLWYLLALFVWTMLVPFIDRKTPKKRILILMGAFLISFLSGYDASIGYYMSLSRIIVFFPYFLMGYYYRRSCLGIQEKLAGIKKGYIAILAGTMALLVWYLSGSINSKWLYGSYTYAALEYGFRHRLFFYLCGIAAISTIIRLFPKEKTMFSYIGQRSMQIFLLHGWIVEILRDTKVIWNQLDENQTLAVSVLLSGIVVWILSFDLLKRINAILEKLVPYSFNKQNKLLVYAKKRIDGRKDSEYNGSVETIQIRE